MMQNMRLSRPTWAARGFTLIEVMVVVVILSILAAVVVPRIMDNPDKARAVKAKQDIRVIKNQLDLYKLHNFRYPTTEQGLDALVQRPADAPHWQEGGYLARVAREVNATTEPPYASTLPPHSPDEVNADAA